MVKQWGVAAVLTCALTLFGSCAYLHGPAHAQDPVSVWGVEQHDLDEDGHPDLTVLDCSFATKHDRVSVYTDSKNRPWTQDWRQATDFQNDTWVFDVGANDDAQLIIRFQADGSRPMALVYDDRDGNGIVRYRISTHKPHIEILESQHWTLSARLTRGDDWQLSSGHLNQNLLFTVDGYLPNSIQGTQAFSWHRGFGDQLLNDGRPDYTMETMDEDLDGIADYHVLRLLAPSPVGWGISRAGVFVNPGSHQQAVPADFILWPVLGPADRYREGNYFDSPPLIHVNWSTGRVDYAGILGYPIESGYHIRGSFDMTRGKICRQDFENPVAYYDLASDQDGAAEMHIRLFRISPIYDANLRSPLTEVRYSWNQSNHSGYAWDFKIGLAGYDRIEDTVRLGDYVLETVGYSVLPYWVTERDWSIGTLVAVEGISYLSGEGIYEWGPLSWDVDFSNPASTDYHLGYEFRYYLDGIHTTQPKTPTRIRPGLRAEYASTLDGHPFLYLSSIDRRIHLVGAGSGLWNVDDRSEIQYANLDGDAHLDQWQYLERGEVRRQLNLAGGYLVYGGDGWVLLKKADIAPSLFETYPPRNYEEWLALGQQLEAHQQGFAPDDFEAMVAQFEGPEWRVEGAQMRGFRQIPDGFRFVLTLQPGFSLKADDWFGRLGLLPGEYVAEYTPEEGFSFLPLTPVQLSVVSVELDTDGLAELMPVGISTVISNTGLDDARGVEVSLHGTDEFGHEQLIVTQTLTVLAQQVSQVDFTWTPMSQGKWTIAAEAKHDGHTVGSRKVVDVIPAASVGPSVIIPASLPSCLAPMALLSLLALAGLAGLTLWYTWPENR